MIWQHVEVSWIDGITFSRWAMVSKFGKTSFLEVKLRISEIHLQQQIHDSDKERLKMIIEFYTILT